MKVFGYDISGDIINIFLDKNEAYDLRKVFIALVICIGSKWSVDYVLAWREARYLSQMRERKRRECQEALKTLRNSLPTSYEAVEQRKQILQLSSKDLLQQLRDEKLRPIDVLKAYQHAALDAHDRTNCLTEPIKEASEWALELESQPKGLLYGLPIALKDDINCLKGYDGTMGLARHIGKPGKEDSLLVKSLKAEGAVIFARTNVPQMLMSFECSNCIFGLTVNAVDSTRGAGGSSGGTAALVAAGGALVSGGGDMAGSIRNPAAFNGVFGFKPTSTRISVKGGVFPFLTVPLALPSIGPIARSMDVLIRYQKSLWSEMVFRQDPTIVPMPFQEDVYSSTKPLRIGFFVNNGYFRASPACERAVLEAKTVLERCGHTLVPYTPNNAETLSRFFYICCGGDGGHSMLDSVKNDAIDTVAFGPVISVLKMPNLLKKFLAIVCKPFSRTTSDFLWYASGSGSVLNWWKETVRRAVLVQEFFDDWEKKNIDGLLCPAFGTHALPIGSRQALIAGATYTALFNVLDCPAGVVPVTTVTLEDQERAKSYPEVDQAHIEAKKGAENSVGLPICVQCVALPCRDEVCLRMMNDIDRSLH